MSELTPEQAQAQLDATLDKPLDELSTVSITAVAEAAAVIAKAKAEEASRAAEAARTAMAKAEAIRNAAVWPPEDSSADEPETAYAPAVTPLPEAVEAAPEVETASPEEPLAATDETVLAEPEEEEEVVSETAAPDTHTAEQHLSLNQRLDDPSEVTRLLDSVRSASRDISASRIAGRHAAPARRPGDVLEPVAHQAGLYEPKGKPPRKPILTVRLGIQIVLLTLFVLYATGNLPQFDHWADTTVDKAQAHNDQIVHTLVRAAHMTAYFVAATVLLLIILRIVKTLREGGETKSEV